MRNFQRYYKFSILTCFTILIKKHGYYQLFSKKRGFKWPIQQWCVPKRFHKGSSASDNIPNSPEDVFEEILKSFDFVKIWPKCLQNLD